MAYTSIVDNSSITLAKLKVYLKIDTDDTVSDPILKLALQAAKEAADNYCQDNFTTVPAAIDMWILSSVLLWWERKSPFIITTEFKDLGKTQWAFNYDDYFFVLKPYRREVGFGPF